MWMQAWAVFRTSCILLDIADLGTVLAYEKLMARYAMRYGHAAWLIQYQADVRTRCELWPRLRLRLETAHSMATAAGNLTPFDPLRPWNYTILKSLEDRDWWHIEVEEPALLLNSRSQNLAQLVSGKAPVATVQMSQAAQSPPPQVKLPQHNQPAAVGQPLKKAPRLLSSERVDNRNADGSFNTNRSNVPLCASFQLGTCGNHVQGRCPSDRSKAHQCSACLSPAHGQSSCHGNQSRKGASAPPKGKGKNKGKGQY